MRNVLQKSLNQKWCIRFLTNHPARDAYNGVVLHLSKSIVIVREFRDFVSDGIIVFPKKSIASIRDGNFEVCENKILRRSGEIASAKTIAWLKNVGTVKDLLSSLSKRNIWPAIEKLKKADSALFVGPITATGKKSFTIYCYDAAGNWEDAYDINYGDVFRIEFNSKYLNYFNDYMRTSNKALKRVSGNKSPVRIKGKTVSEIVLEDRR